MSDLVTAQTHAVARPLRVLSALIKENFKKAEEAAEEAAIPFWRAAGNELIEAQGQQQRNEFWPWALAQFNKSKSQLQRYMELAGVEKYNPSNRARGSMSDAMRDAGKEPRGSDRGGANVQEAIQDKLESFNWDRYNQEQAEKAKERGLIKKLALEMIDIGFKVLAVKLHPDKTTGSKEAMHRLNEARRLLKEKLQ